MVLDDYRCVLCGTGVIETLDHIFLQCNFATQFWAKLNLRSNQNMDQFKILEEFKTRLQLPFFRLSPVMGEISPP
jgi:hypothetical protein